MYETFFGLSRKPFSASPDPSMYVPSESSERTLRRLTYAVRENTGGFLLTGPSGCGKTLLLEKIATTGAANLEFLFIRAGRMDGDSLAAALLRAAALYDEAAIRALDRNSAVYAFGKYLQGKASGGARFAIIIDGAEWIESDGLSVLEMVNDLRRDGTFLATFVLSGRDSVAKKILALPGLRDRFSLSARVEPLERGQTDRFVLGRLSAAGAEKDIFAPEALADIFVYSKGVPRRINRVCDLALLTAFGLERLIVDGEIMEAVIDELAQAPI